MIDERNNCNLFACETDAIVNPVNCKGFMGKGIALEFKKRYPSSYQRYKAACDAGELRPGKVLYIPGIDGERSVLHFPTKDHWKGRSRLEWLRSGLEYIRSHYAEWGLTSIAMPELGCGLGGLRWEQVGPSVQDILGPLDDLTVIVCRQFTQKHIANIAKSKEPAVTTEPTTPTYPKRLIEVDLPIKRISAHSRREKSIRHGHISTLHIWWARRPLAACRAVICASLWPDPADELCPQAFRDEAARQLKQFAAKVVADKKLAEGCDQDTRGKWVLVAKPEFDYDTGNANHMNMLRFHLLDFIADFANWDNSTVKEYLETSRALTQAAHEALGGVPGTKPLVVDPFAGGGAIPLEALRVGADAFASDLNPVAVLLNKVVLEYIPKYGQQLADEVRKWGKWIKEEAEKELAEFYPKDPDGATPIAYLWARTIRCEGPGCGAEVPLIRSLWLAKKGKKSVALRMIPNPAEKRVDFEIIENAKAEDVGEGTVKRGSATCLCCGYTTRVESVRRQLKEREGGAHDARMFAVVTTKPAEQGRLYRLPIENDLEMVRKAAVEMENKRSLHVGRLSLVPDEELDIRAIRLNWCMLYGITTFGHMFSPRQSILLITLVSLVTKLHSKLDDEHDGDLATAIGATLSLIVSRMADGNSSLSRWQSTGEKISNTFGRQALPMIWDYCEANPFCDATRSLLSMVSWVARVAELQAIPSTGQAERMDAVQHPLPDDSVDAFITDPPYYDAIPYAYLSDFFYVWMKRTQPPGLQYLFSEVVSPKEEEIVVDRAHRLSNTHKDLDLYESRLTCSFLEGKRMARANAIGLIVFASKTTSSWEAVLQAIINAGWIVTGSWPIDTEMSSKLSALNQARLMSSIHIVCRPREGQSGSASPDSSGDWRTVLAELPVRIHEWMPRLAREGVVGADAIFSCLGPALEIFSRYSQVEKASGDQVTLKEYLEEVWAAVSKEALNMIFENADASEFEEDARITAMWLWTLSTGSNGNGPANGRNGSIHVDDGSSDDGEQTEATRQRAGYALEFDAARKIAQGLGVHLEKIDSVVEVKGDTARLLPVAERARHLLGRDEVQPVRQRKKRDDQMTLDGMHEIADSDPSDGHIAIKSGETVLDRIHQSMLLFSAGRSEALQRFLVEDAVGRDQRFWRLAQALSALYPKDSDEKRWVDGVLARKKGLGL